MKVVSFCWVPILLNRTLSKPPGSTCKTNRRQSDNTRKSGVGDDGIHNTATLWIRFSSSWDLPSCCSVVGVTEVSFVRQNTSVPQSIERNRGANDHRDSDNAFALEPRTAVVFTQVLIQIFGAHAHKATRQEDRTHGKHE